MAKSKGNFILLRQALEWWGADATRWAEVLAGADAGLDDANFEPTVAEKAAEELVGWIKFAESNYGKGRSDRLVIDEWFESVLNRTVLEVTNAMEAMEYKTALVKAYYNMQANYKWYLKRAGTPNRELLRKYIEYVTIMIAPFVPHVAEEVWSRIGKKSFAALAKWPTADESKIRDDIERAEEIIKRVIDDIKEIKKFVKEARNATIIVSSQWKYDFVKNIIKARDRGLDLKSAIQEAMKNLSAEYKKKAGRLVPIIMQNPDILNLYIDKNLELRILKEAEDFIAKESGLSKVSIRVEEEYTVNKKKIAMPAKPAIILE